MEKSKFKKPLILVGKPSLRPRGQVKIGEAKPPHQAYKHPSLPSSSKLGKSRTLLNSSNHKTPCGPKTYSYTTDFYPKKAESGKNWAKNFFSVAKICAFALIAGILGTFLQATIDQSRAVKPLLSQVTIASAWGDSQIDIWWPADKTAVSGVQPFKALVNNKNLGDYKMYWQVDSGQLNQMSDSYADYPHKEYNVDLSSWNWKGNGPYTLAFVAFDNNGQKFAEKFEVIYINSVPADQSVQSYQATTSAQASVPVPNINPASTIAALPASGCPAPSANAFTGCYYSGQNFDNYALSRVDNNINFDWGGNSPDAKVPSDRFSVRWEGSFDFNAGDYAFNMTSDDGSRLFIDNQPVLDQWSDHAATTKTATKTLAAGSHTIKMEYYENSGGAVAKLNWSQTAANAAPVNNSQPVTNPAPVVASGCPAPGSSAFTGCYYSDQNFNNLALARTDNSVNFDWGGGSPDAKVPSDHFSARWQGNFSFENSDYEFAVTADDGFRLYVDGALVLDKYFDQAPATYKTVKSLTAGTHAVKMDYYENGGGAVAKLAWSKITATAQQISYQVPAVNNPPAPAPTPSPAPSGNILAGAKLYVDPNSNAKRQADQWRSSRPQDANMMDKIASSPNAVWLGSWNGDIRSDVNNLVTAAQSQGTVPVMIAYNIPNRDCGGYSAGGAQTADAYKSWINSLAAGIGNRKAAVILEPDAITLTNCLSSSDLQTRYDLLKYAISTLKSQGPVVVYLDAGHAKWLSADELAGKLQSAGIAQADGFSLNTSNFVTTQDNLAYGQTVSGKVGGRHFLIDTSRNGNGPTPDNQWCNPSGRALGNKPTTNTGNPLADAFIWGKQPGESDGQCNGGPTAGTWWPDYALGLAQRANW